MADVFVSYSRRDAAFVRRLVESMEEAGKSVWIDTEGIGDGEVFPEAIRTAIEEANAFVFVITPAAVASSYCDHEVDYAIDLHKRLVPILREPVPDPELPATIRERNWIPFTEEDEYERSLTRLTTSLDRDLDHVREHTRWLVKAVEWEKEGHDKSFLLRGTELSAAETWLAGAGTKDPGPTPLQLEYLVASRAASTRRQRILVSASLATAVLSIGLLVFALISRDQAIDERTTAKSRALAAQSQSAIAVDPELSILLGVEALRTKATPDAFFALRDAIDQSPVRLRLTSLGEQECAGQNALPGIAYAPGGGLLARGACDGRIALDDERAETAARRIRVGKTAPVVAFSPKGSVLAVGTEDGVRLLDPRSGRPRGALPGSGAVRGLAFSPDGSLLAISSTGGLRLWNISSGAATPLDRRGIFTRLTFARGGDLLVAATFDPNAPVNDVHVFDVAGRRETQVLRSFGAVDDLAVDPSGSRLAMAELDWKSGLGEVTLWNARTWKRAGAPIRFPALEITTVAFSPDGEQLALGAADGTAGVWTLDGRQLTAFRGHTSAIGQVAFGRGGLEVATTSFDGTARVWRTRPDDELEIAVGPPGSFVGGGLLEQGRLVAVSFPDVLRTWEFPGGKAIGSLSVGTGPNAPAPQLSEDGVLAAAIKPAAIEVWNVAERRAVRRLPLNGEYPIVAFSSDHRRLGVLAEPKGSETARPSPVVMSLGGSTVLRLARPTRPCASGWRDAEFTRDGTLFAGATFCGDVDVWNAKTGRRVASYAATGQISGIAFDPAGKVLAVSGWDSSLALVEPRTGRLVRVLNGPQRGLTGVALSPDGEIVAASSLDGTVWLWDADGRRLRILRHPSAAAVTGFSADGRFVVTQSDDVLRVWRTCEACEDRDALMALAGSRVTRELTPLERSTFLSGS